MHRFMLLQGWIKLLHQMVLKLPEVSNLKSLMVLCNEDGEEIFFDNISDSVVCFCSEHFMVICYYHYFLMKQLSFAFAYCNQKHYQL